MIILGPYIWFTLLLDMIGLSNNILHLCFHMASMHIDGLAFAVVEGWLLLDIGWFVLFLVVAYKCVNWNKIYTRLWFIVYIITEHVSNIHRCMEYTTRYQRLSARRDLISIRWDKASYSRYSSGSCSLDTLMSYNVAQVIDISEWRRR